jgi:hypothetical protein
MKTTVRHPAGPARRNRGLAITLLALTVILLATLPSAGHEVPSSSPWCLLCGSMGSADAVLNTLLFVPLGFGLGLLSPALWAGVIGGALTSGFVETVQVFVAGRDASLGDLLSNVAGAAAGALAGRHWRVWILPHAREARRLRYAWAVGAVGSFVAAALLLAPALPQSTWYVQWTARLGHFAPYHGRIINTSLAGAPLRPGPVRESRTALAQLRSGAPLTILFHAGPPPAELAPIVSIYDDAQREILVVGARGADLVVRYRTRAMAMRFDGSETVLRNALGGVRWQHPRMLVNVADVRHDTGPGLHTAPSILLYSQPVLGSGAALATALWLAFLFVPLGFWTSNRALHLVPALLCAIALILVPLVIPLRQLPVHWLAFSAAAVAAGVLGRSAIARHAMH